jgi:phosphoribosylformimino-5-aminoimidazole carboxamide ribotide isomerase
MEILPAIDLKDGKAVRLQKGLMSSAKIYNDNPHEIAKEFERLGSKWIHIVDLNGAFAGTPKNLDEIIKIREVSNLKIEIGGGIRDEETIKQYIKLGVNRVILGSKAVSDLDFTKEMAEKYDIVIGIDAKDSMVAVDGWGDVSLVSATNLASKFKNSSIKAIIYTDISRDGTLSGVNINQTKEIQKISNKITIASGGVKDINDIKNLVLSGLDGVIIGKAFYENSIDLKEAIRVGSIK